MRLARTRLIRLAGTLRCLALATSTIYLVSVSTSSFSREEVRAAAEIHGEIGPDYQAAVVDSFLDKVGREIDARVDARLAARAAAQPPAPARKPIAPALVLLSTMVAGIPLSAIAVGVGPNPAGTAGLFIIWVAITVINVAYALGNRPRGDGR
jgi:hypothetical protein